MKNIDITGKKFGRLTAIRFHHNKTRNNGRTRQYWLCKCDCGKETIVLKSNLGKKVFSCGCLQKEQARTICSKNFTKHSLSNTRLFKIWVNMKERCLNKKNTAFKNYGGRGISVCAEWISDFMNFYNWAINNGYQDNLTIDRIDNNGNYEPNNCRWADRKEQGRNKRNNVIVIINDKKYCASELSELLKIPYKRLLKKIHKNNLQNYNFS